MFWTLYGARQAGRCVHLAPPSLVRCADLSHDIPLMFVMYMVTFGFCPSWVSVERIQDSCIFMTDILTKTCDLSFYFCNVYVV